jgi:hypothetical protein
MAVEQKRYARGPLPGAKALSAVLRKVAGPAMRRRGFFEVGLIADWPAIVGAYLAEHCTPEKLTFPRGRSAEATLELRVDGAFAPELQHLEPQIVERINGHFGFAAVARLKFIHGPRRTTGATKPRVRDLSPEEEAALDSRLAAVESSALRAALKRLGRAMLGRGEAQDGPRPKLR